MLMHSIIFPYIEKQIIKNKLNFINELKSQKHKMYFFFAISEKCMEKNMQAQHNILKNNKLNCWEKFFC